MTMQVTALINKRSELITRLDAIISEIDGVKRDAWDWASDHRGNVADFFYRDRDDLIQEHKDKFAELENVESELSELGVDISDGGFERHDRVVTYT